MANTFKDQSISRQFSAAYSAKPIYETWDGAARIKHPGQVGRNYSGITDECEIYWGRERLATRMALRETVRLVNSGFPAENLADPTPSRPRSSVLYACS